MQTPFGNEAFISYLQLFFKWSSNVNASLSLLVWGQRVHPEKGYLWSLRDTYVVPLKTNMQSSGSKKKSHTRNYLYPYLLIFKTQKWQFQHQDQNSLLLPSFPPILITIKNNVCFSSYLNFNKKSYVLVSRYCFYEWNRVTLG